ncbi:hypothetical protein HZC07_01390, partial [Candidatus Micrarchaeota archaeon]|nr:hypothetical protein [Candidatus Micrarchaeota archaeon]
EALTKLSAPKASVIRDDVEIEIDSTEVVPGDLLVLTEGDKVAADARILRSFSLYSDESALTGESVPVLKKTDVVAKDCALAERSNIIFTNSVITRGRGNAIVVETGSGTEIGKIAREISEAPDKVTQFQVEIEDLGKKIFELVKK